MDADGTAYGRHVSAMYVNASHVRIGPYDLTIDFGLQSSIHDRESHDPLFRVTMSLSHAKSLLKILADQVAHYEEHYGVVPSPHYKDSPNGNDGEPADLD
jgi:hypothetical protein